MNWRSRAEFVRRCKGQSPAICAEMSRRWDANYEKRRASQQAKLVASDRRRKDMLRDARGRGRHTPAEWQALPAACGHACLRCARTEQHRNVFITKDHILAVSLGGSDAIENIQPLCVECNSSKGAKGWGDLRPAGWQRAQVRP